MSTLQMTAAIVSVTCALTGCVTTVETSDGRPMPPQPHDAPATPEASPINALAVVFGAKPLDTNGNMRPDLIQMQIYLFSRPYPRPVWRDGDLEVRLYTPGTARDPRNPGPSPIRSWRVPSSTLQQVRAKSLVGDCYAVSVSLLNDGATDDLGTSAVDVIVRFLPADGSEPVPMNEVRTMSMSSPVVPAGR